MAFTQLPAALNAKRDACLARLESPRRGDRRLYAIVDLAASTDAAFWHARLAGANARSLFDGLPEAEATVQAPWLLCIEADDTRIGLRRTVDEALVAWNVAWVSSALPPDTLAQRLSRRFTARLPEGEALFRYYDPRLFSPWWSALSDGERACFGAFGAQWWSLAADGALHAESLPGEPTVDPLLPPWYVAPAQLQALTEASEHQQLTRFLGKRCPDAFLDMNRGEQWRFVRTHDADARARCLTQLADRLRYCELALEHGEGFALQARWQPVWAAMANGKQRFSQALELLENDAPAKRGATEHAE